MGATCGPAGFCAGCCGAGISFFPLVIPPSDNKNCCAECCLCCDRCCQDDIYSCQGCCSDCYGDMCVRQGWFSQWFDDCRRGGCNGCCGAHGDTCCRGCDTCWNCCGDNRNTMRGQYQTGVPNYATGAIPMVSTHMISPFTSPTIDSVPIIVNPPPVAVVQPMRIVQRLPQAFVGSVPQRINPPIRYATGGTFAPIRGLSPMRTGLPAISPRSYTGPPLI